MTAEEHIAFQLCAAMDVEPTQEQLGDLVGVLIRYKHAQKIATGHLERELSAWRNTFPQYEFDGASNVQRRPESLPPQWRERDDPKRRFDT